MNIPKLKALESAFYKQYPGGFESDELKRIVKRHKVGKLNDMAQEVLSKEALASPEALKGIRKLISTSTMVSVYEKVPFRDLLDEADELLANNIVHAIYDLIHGDQESGFEQLVSLLAPYKLAKWPILTVLLTYYHPTEEVFVKPTTVKKIIQHLELENLTYTPKPNYAFYQEYRRQFLELTKQVDPALSETNGHFSGFLMMTLK